ncbi:glycosyltransferase family 39 protein [Lactococcus muris]|uniref:glycosyltransferase family 39 protein n=1 Tax=Lactococcus muris TaxID=2941330 RepID=UPI0023004EA1
MIKKVYKDKFDKFINKAIFVLAFLFSALWLFNTVRSDNFAIDKVFSKNGGYIFIAALIIMTVAYLKRSELKKWGITSIEFLTNHLFVLFGIMVFFQIIILLFASGLAGYDIWGLYHHAVGDLNIEKSPYLQMYPNNFLLFLLMKAVHSLTALQILNIIAIDFSIIILFFTARTLFGKRAARYSTLIFMATLGFTPWLLNTYSDTFVLPFVALGMFFLSKWDQKNTEPLHRFTYLLAAGFSSAVAYYLKPSAIIFVIAYFLLSALKCTKIKTLLIPLAVFFIGALLFAAPLKVYVNHQTIVHFDKDKEFPSTHFMMLGLSKNGMYNKADVNLTRSAKTAKEKKQVNIEVIKQRLKKLGVVGYVQFLYGKYYKNTHDGTYAWGADGGGRTGFMVKPNLNDSEKLSPFIHSKFGEFLRSFIYTDDNGPGYQNGENTFVYRFFSQIIYIIMVLGILLSTLKEKYDFKIMWLLLAMIGLMMFLLLFEGGRSRYLIQAIPVFTLLSGYGYSTVPYLKEKMLNLPGKREKEHVKS